MKVRKLIVLIEFGNHGNINYYFNIQILKFQIFFGIFSRYLTFFQVALLAVVFTLAFARADPGPFSPQSQYFNAPQEVVSSHHDSAPFANCHVTYKTYTETVCKNIPNKVCETVAIKKYRKEVAGVCHTVHQRRCHIVTKTEPDQKCHVHIEKNCTKKEETVFDTFVKQTCKEIEKEVKIKHEMTIWFDKYLSEVKDSVICDTRPLYFLF